MNDIADEEVIEIFVEETGEVCENLDNHLPIWHKRPDDMDVLGEIRRGFHTIKGSGRMVNALDLSEVAWKIENMLNRVIDGKIRVTESMIELVSSARSLLPRMLEDFKNHRPMGTESEAETLMAQADALATGQTPTPVRAQPEVAAAGAQGPALERAELERRLGRFQQRSDEALRRSEMALQQVRRLANHIQAMEAEAQDRVSRTEVNRIIERVNLLAREVLDLRREAKRPQPQQPPRSRELSQLVDHRIRDRLAPIERQRKDIAEQLAEAQDAAASSRTLAWWAMIIGALAGGGAVAALLLPGL